MTLKAISKHLLQLHLELYRLHVIIAWELPIHDVAKYCRRNGCSITDDWIRSRASFAAGANGICTNLGDGNTDVLIWLKQGPHRDFKASEYGTLYHELFHAVDRITRSHNLHDEEECRAYIYEWLATQCNKFFWSRRQTKVKSPRNKGF